MKEPALEVMRTGNPAARSLPLLELLANPKLEMVLLPYQHGQSLKIGVSSC
jgi:hypothetical protein